MIIWEFQSYSVAYASERKRKWDCPCKVINPVQFSYNKLEKALERKYGLKEVIVVESSALDTKTESVSRMYERAALLSFAVL